MEYDWILDEAKKIEEKIVSHRRYLHQNAEVGFLLEKTQAYVVSELEKIGCEAKLQGK